jgi:hypothetical protein
MNTKIVFLLPFFFLSLNFHAQTQKKELTLETGTIFNISNFDWSIAGNLEGNSPNILSELKFNNIASLGCYFKGNYTPVTYLKFSIFFQQNKVINGNGSDIDYKEDNRTNPTFEKKFRSNKGDFMLFKGGVGTPVHLSTKVTITPSLFYYLTKQKLYILSNLMEELRSTYRANMKGIEISIEGNIQLNKIIYSSLTISHHFVDYKAEADWNLIDVFKHPLSFSQTSKGSGLEVNVLLEGSISRVFSIIVSGSLNTTTIRKGTDTSYLITGNDVSTQFNGAKNILYGLGVGIRASF